MTSASIIGALAVMMLTMTMPAGADIIADQSRISPFASHPPGLDQEATSSSKNNTARY